MALFVETDIYSVFDGYNPIGRLIGPRVSKWVSYVKRKYPNLAIVDISFTPIHENGATYIFVSVLYRNDTAISAAYALYNDIPEEN